MSLFSRDRHGNNRGDRQMYQDNYREKSPLYCRDRSLRDYRERSLHDYRERSLPDYRERSVPRDRMLPRDCVTTLDRPLPRNRILQRDYQHKKPSSFPGPSASKQHTGRKTQEPKPSVNKEQDQIAKQISKIKKIYKNDCCVREDLVNAVPDSVMAKTSSEGCVICNYTQFQCEETMRTHLSSWKHWGKVTREATAAYQIQKKEVPEGLTLQKVVLGNRRKVCEICNETFDSMESANLHYNGKIHPLVAKGDRMVKNPELLVAPEGIKKGIELKHREMTVFNTFSTFSIVTKDLSMLNS